MLPAYLRRQWRSFTSGLIKNQRVSRLVASVVRANPVKIATVHPRDLVLGVNNKYPIQIVLRCRGILGSTEMANNPRANNTTRMRAGQTETERIAWEQYYLCFVPRVNTQLTALGIVKISKTDSIPVQAEQR